jgi:hypothetical protein
MIWCMIWCMIYCMIYARGYVYKYRRCRSSGARFVRAAHRRRRRRSHQLLVAPWFDLPLAALLCIRVMLGLVATTVTGTMVLVLTGMRAAWRVPLTLDQLLLVLH